MNERQKDQAWLEADRASKEKLAANWPKNLPAYREAISVDEALFWLNYRRAHPSLTQEQIARASEFWASLVLCQPKPEAFPIGEALLPLVLLALFAAALGVLGGL